MGLLLLLTGGGGASASATEATATGTASQAAASIAVNAAVASSSGTAHDATISLASNVNANAEVAAATGAAGDVDAVVAPGALVAAATGTAADAAVPTFISAPYLDDSATYAPTFLQPTTFIAPYLDGGVGFAPHILHGAVEELAVFVSGVEITNAIGTTFRDELNDVGSWSFQVPHSWLLDNWSAIDFDDLVQIKVFGIVAFSGYVAGMDITHIDAEAEAAGQNVTVSGAGRGSIFGRDVIYPSRGVEAQPIEDVRSFSWPSPDYDDTNWPTAKIINSQRRYADFGEGYVGGGGPVPHIWPKYNGSWIWANRDDCTATVAPAGQAYFRKTFTLAADATVRFFSSFDNGGTLYVDGAEVVPFTIGFMEGEYVQLFLTAGDHVIAAYAENAPHAGPNPGGFICAAYTTEVTTGLLDELVVETDATWKCLGYPEQTPGFTHGEVLETIISEGVGRGTYTGLTEDFSPTMDSEGNPWSEYKDISVGVGRTGLEVLVEMSQSYIDWEVLHGTTPTLRAWVLGERGVDVSATVVLSRFLALRHVGKQVRLNKALTRYAGGHIQTTDATSVSTYGARGGYLELGDVRSEDAATRTTEQVMADRKDPAWSTQAEIIIEDVGVFATTPYRSFRVGDTISCLNEQNAQEDMRVVAITAKQDLDTQVVTWTIELRNVYIEAAIRHEAWLRRMADGALFGGARVSAAHGTPNPSSSRITAIRTAEFSFDNSQLVVSTSPTRPVDVSSNIVEVYGQLTSPGSTATTVQVWLLKDGVEVLLGTLTFAAGATEDEFGTDAIRVLANLDKAWIVITAAGTSAEGLNVQLRGL